ncbi:MAG: hypothetical protein HYS56_02720 [Candidatus Omnitrophica bacterium]|nr:hypothetical protein [Candidatus Omnitrophota bacterium]
MTPRRKFLWTAIWFLAVLLFWGLFPKREGKWGGAPQNPPQSQSLASSPSPDAEKALRWGRDPFVMAEPAVISGTNRLTGIIFDENRVDQSYAIIDQQLVKAGDNINGARVVQINRDSVIIEINGEQEELLL